MRPTVLSILVVVIVTLGVSDAAAGRPGVGVLAAAQIAHDPVRTPAGTGNQSDVMIQSQVATSAGDPRFAAAVTEDGLQTTPGGTFGVALTLAVTRDGGRTWRSRVVPGITVAAGGAWQGVSWPTVAVGPGRTIYVVGAVRQGEPCRAGLGVTRSVDGGRRFSPLVLVQHHVQCGVSEGRSSLAVDSGAHSSHRGRLYLAWTSYRTDSSGADIGQVQTLSHSDDRGRTWSAPANLTALDSSTFGNTLLVGPRGRLTDVYASNSPDFTSTDLAAISSHDGGRTFEPQVVIDHWTFAAAGAADIRCCAPSAAVDPVTGVVYAALGDARLQAGQYDDALVYRSGDGTHWTAPVRADTSSPAPDLEHMTPEVAAYAGTVWVTWTLTPDPNGTSVQQQLARSRDGGRSFGAPVSLGPEGDLRAAAGAGAFAPYWLGDVIGIAAARGRAYVAWPLPTVRADRPQHQTLWAATVAEHGR